MFSSIRTKLTLWYLSLLTLVIAGFGVVAYELTIRTLDRDLHSRLEATARLFISDLVADRDEDDENLSHDEMVARNVDELQVHDFPFAVVSKTGNFKAASNDLQGMELNPAGVPLWDVSVGNDRYRVFESEFTLGNDKYVLVVAHSLAEQTGLENGLIVVFLISGAAVLIISAIGGYFLVRRSIEPIVAMSREASGISPDELRTRLTVRNDRDEVGRLGMIINSLLDRLSSSLEQQRRFVADASHELRTPLAILRGEAEVALAHNDRPAEDYRTSLGILHDESIHMAKIVDDLFTLARADAGQIQFHAKSLYLEEIVEEAVRSIRVLAAKKDITIECALEHCVPYEGDESLLRRLFLNLLDNAVKYSRPHSTVIVSGKLSVDKRVYLVNIADSGLGIPESDRDKIFERFYRVDKARTREDGAFTSGAGLGLSIANWIADVHSAEIRLTSSSESGSIFAVSFPILS